MSDPHGQRQLDCSAAARGVWLVKVPKYLSERWQLLAENNSELGKLKITKTLSGKADVVLSANDQALAGVELAPIPRDHKFVLSGPPKDELSVMTEESLVSRPSMMAIEGKVIQRAECRPVADNNYLQLKRRHVQSLNEPQRKVIQLETVIQAYKPVASHPSDIQAEKLKREDGKRVRDNKDVVMTKLFTAFERHQYYNVKDLVMITKQPITYLKEILSEICTYNTKAPHRNMYELKPEFRHYQTTND